MAIAAYDIILKSKEK